LADKHKFNTLAFVPNPPSFVLILYMYMFYEKGDNSNLISNFLK